MTNRYGNQNNFFIVAERRYVNNCHVQMVYYTCTRYLGLTLYATLSST